MFGVRRSVAANPGGDGACTLPGDVTLPAPLPCQGSTCGADEVGVVSFVHGSRTAYYEYSRTACVTFPFYEDGKVAKAYWGKNDMVCANPLKPDAHGACCDSAVHLHRKFSEDLCWEKPKGALQKAFILHDSVQF